MVYRILHFIFGLAVRMFFRRIEVQGIENVPASGPVLLLPNHPNALADALVILVKLDRPVSLTAKSTLAYNPLLRFFIRLTNVILLHRKQDVKKGSDPSRNLGAIEECSNRLRKGAAVCLFPEGQSHSDSALRPFRWGAARIALAYQETGDTAAPLTIVPVGLNFLNKDQFRSDVWLRFGEPIQVTEWIRNNPEGDAALLTSSIEQQVKELTLNFEKRRDSVLMEWAAEILGTGGLPPVPIGQDQPKVSSHLTLVRLIRDGYEQLKEKRSVELKKLQEQVRRYRSELRQLGIAPGEVYILMTWRRAAFFILQETTVLLVGLPVALFGLVNHLLPAVVVRAIAKKMANEKDQWASCTIFPSIVFFPLFYTIQLTLVWLFLSPVLASAYTVLLPLSGYAAIRYGDRAGGTWQRARTFIMFMKQPGLQSRLADEGREIIKKIQEFGEELGEDST